MAAVKWEDDEKFIPQDNTGISANDWIMMLKGDLTNNSKSKVKQFSLYLENNTLPFFYNTGMRISYLDTTTLEIAIGACKDSTNTYNIYFNSVMLLDLYSSGIGGLDTGSPFGSNTYYISVIHDSTGVNPDGPIFSLNSGAPVYPAGYDSYEQRGSIQTIGGFFAELDPATLIDNFYASYLSPQDPTFTGTLSSLNGDFAWDSALYNLVAGEGAHETGGTGNILLGKGATTNKNNCYVFCDGTNTTGGSYFPAADNQYCVWAAGGFGIGVLPSGGPGTTQGPQAGFHFGHNCGNDGKNIISGAGPVDTTKMVANEINFFVDSATAQFKATYKSNVGDVNNLYFPAGDHLLAKTDDTVLTGLTSTELLSVHSFFCLNDAVFPSVESGYSTTTTISASDMHNKTILCGGAGGITLTLPTGTDFNGSFYTSPPVNYALEGITITNASLGTVTIANNTGFTIGGMPNPIILAGETRPCKVRKSTSAPAFIIYG